MSAENLPEKVFLAKPRAFCAGVERAIRITDELLSQTNKPLYVYHQIVHNKHVVEGFEGKGVVFVEDISLIPQDSLVIFSAHGVSPGVREQAKTKNLAVEDATCPLVDKVHREIKKYQAQGYEILLIGHADHDETIGHLGEAPDKIKLVSSLEDVKNLKVFDPERLALVTQTTLSVDDTKQIADSIRAKFPKIVEPKKADICFATTNRQNGVKAMVDLGAETVLILGSENSSNSKRLKEVAESAGAKAFLFDDCSQFSKHWILNAKIIGVTAGASASNLLVEELISHLKAMGILEFEDIEVAKEGFSFK